MRLHLSILFLLWHRFPLTRAPIAPSGARGVHTKSRFCPALQPNDRHDRALYFFPDCRSFFFAFWLLLSPDVLYPAPAFSLSHYVVPNTGESAHMSRLSERQVLPREVRGDRVVAGTRMPHHYCSHNKNKVDTHPTATGANTNEQTFLFCDENPCF